MTFMPSRGMISGEISWAFFAVCFAYAGSGIPPFHDGPLYLALSARAEPLLWSLLLALPSITLFALDARELVAHRRCISDCAHCWTCDELARSAMLRGRLCLALLLGWGYMLHVMAHATKFSVLALIAAGGCVFMWWFYKENRRVRREIHKSRRYVDCISPAG